MEQPDDLQPALKGHEHADVVVVGAGSLACQRRWNLGARGANVTVSGTAVRRLRGQRVNAGYLLGSMGIECEVFSQLSGA